MMKTKRFVYEIRNYYINSIANRNVKKEEFIRCEKYVKAYETGLISAIECVNAIINGRLRGENDVE